MALPEKLHRLGSLIYDRISDIHKRARFGAVLHACRWANTERTRVLDTYLHAEENVWLHPLCELSDGLGDACFELEEVLCCELDGFTRLKSGPAE